MGKWALLMFLGSIIFGVKLFRKYHWSLAVLFVYMCGSAIYTFHWPYNTYQSQGLFSKVMLAQLSVLALISIIFISILLAELDLKDIMTLESFFVLLVLVNSVVVIYQWINGNPFHRRGGLFDNIGMNGILMAFTYPLLIDSNLLKKSGIGYIIALLLPIIAILCTKSSVPVGVVIIGIMVYLIFKFKNIILKISIPTLIGIIILLTAYITNKKDLFDDSQRFGLYKIQYNEWVKSEKILFGHGLGTYPFFGLQNQIKNQYMVKGQGQKVTGEYAMWLHNDWLQLLLETGVIGFILFVVAAFFSIYYALLNPKLIACLLSYMSSMLFYYPNHFAIHAFFGCWLIAYIFLKHNYVNERMNWREI